MAPHITGCGVRGGSLYVAESSPRHVPFLEACPIVPADDSVTLELVVVEPAAFAGLAARRLAAEIRRVLEARDRCSLALSGGSTPRPVYQGLAAELPDRDAWRRIDVFFADERCVPPSDSASNYRMAREALLDRVAIDGRQVHRMEGERDDHDEAARAYAPVLPERLDLLVLGLGADGHTASLFPGAASLAESRRRVIAVRAPASPPDRLTITPPVIRDARLTIGLVAGKGKAIALARVLDGPYAPERTPGQLARAGLWIADTAAAGRREEGR
jgi:6-phosphogluconolactonase